MSVFVEFSVPSSEFALHETLEALPELVVEIERVVATDEVLTPYFWISNVDSKTFEASVAKDPSIEEIELLHRFESAALYRAAWTIHIESVVYVYNDIEAVVLEARGTGQRWELQIRFDDHGELEAFQSYCEENEIPFVLNRLYELSTPKTGAQYGLTPKQYEALVSAWENGYFESPREAAAEEIASELGISQQSLSKRLQRAHQSLIKNTLILSKADS
ncbi:helix-turn-helix domain-containing protein [Natrialbaceae archaeon A-CW2]